MLGINSTACWLRSGRCAHFLGQARAIMSSIIKKSTIPTNFTHFQITTAVKIFKLKLLCCLQKSRKKVFRSNISFCKRCRRQFYSKQSSLQKSRKKVFRSNISLCKRCRKVGSFIQNDRVCRNRGKKSSDQTFSCAKDVVRQVVLFQTIEFAKIAEKSLQIKHFFVQKMS